MTWLPSNSSTGRTASNASWGPEHTRVNRPLLTTLPLPLTGAATKVAPRSASLVSIPAEHSAETVEQSTTWVGVRSASASSCSMTSSRSPSADTMVNTTSRSASSTGSSTTVAPERTRGSALARVRFQTATSSPALASRSARAYPIRPVPIQPTLRSADVVSDMDYPLGGATDCSRRTVDSAPSDCQDVAGTKSRSHLHAPTRSTFDHRQVGTALAGAGAPECRRSPRSRGP